MTNHPPPRMPPAFYATPEADATWEAANAAAKRLAWPGRVPADERTVRERVVFPGDAGPLTPDLAVAMIEHVEAEAAKDPWLKGQKRGAPPSADLRRFGFVFGVGDTGRYHAYREDCERQTSTAAAALAEQQAEQERIRAAAARPKLGTNKNLKW